MTTLKPCPRCGGDPVLSMLGGARRRHPRRYWYRCSDPLTCPGHQDAATPEEAAALWNTRPTPAPPTSDELAAIIARNTERRRIKASPATERPWHVHCDDGYWYIYGPNDFQIHNTFNSTATDKIEANQRLIEFCCNDTPEDDVTTLLALVTAKQGQIEFLSDQIAGDNATIAELRAQLDTVRQWLVDFAFDIPQAAQVALRQVLAEGGGDENG